MLFLIEVPAASSGPAIHFTICRGIELSMFGCVGREERRPAQRRKRGCKSRHIRLSSYPFPAHAQQKWAVRSTPAGCLANLHVCPFYYNPTSDLHEFPPTDIRSSRQPAGKTYQTPGTEVGHDWSAQRRYKDNGFHRCRC